MRGKDFEIKLSAWELDRVWFLISEAVQKAQKGSERWKKLTDLKLKLEDSTR